MLFGTGSWGEGAWAVVWLETPLPWLDFDELEDLDSGLIVLQFRGLVDHFWFQDFKEAFGHNVVPAVPFAAHALEDAEQIPEFTAGILYSPVWMENEFIGIDRSVADGHFESGDDGATSVHASAHGPADDFSVK